MDKPPAVFEQRQRRMRGRYFCALRTAVALRIIKHRLNMELDLQSLFGLHVHSCTHWLRPRNPPPHLGSSHIRGRYGQIDDISL
jgi:hypothetical protein